MQQDCDGGSDPLAALYQLEDGTDPHPVLTHAMGSDEQPTVTQPCCVMLGPAAAVPPFIVIYCSVVAFWWCRAEQSQLAFAFLPQKGTSGFRETQGADGAPVPDCDSPWSCSHHLRCHTRGSSVARHEAAVVTAAVPSSMFDGGAEPTHPNQCRRKVCKARY